MNIPLHRRTEIAIPYECNLVPPPDMCWMLQWCRDHGLTLDQLRMKQLPKYNPGVGVVWYRLYNKGWELHLWFARKSDAVLFKLTWGGQLGGIPS